MRGSLKRLLNQEVGEVQPRRWRPPRLQMLKQLQLQQPEEQGKPKLLKKLRNLKQRLQLPPPPPRGEGSQRLLMLNLHQPRLQLQRQLQLLQQRNPQQQEEEGEPRLLKRIWMPPSPSSLPSLVWMLS